LAPWSRPCQLMESVLDEVMTACTGTVKFVKINADNNPDLGIWYEIQSVPTLLYFVNGSLRARIVGTTSKGTILSRMQLTLPCEPTSLNSKSKEK
jgi:thioredoxin-like negative regulator of GroEL